MEAREGENSTLVFLPEESTISVSYKDQLRERIKIEFYKTYDVMTGIRIAATLGGFFSMMILLVLYKNYCKPNKTLSEEQLNAAVTAAAEEEDRALQAALEATSFYTALEKRRQSLENASQVLLSPRFSSVGGGYSHLTPPLKASAIQQRGKSLPGSVLQFGSNGSPCHFQKLAKTKCLTHEEATESREDDFGFACKNHGNAVADRRSSSVTCSSIDSAYLERRCSAFEITMPSQFLGQSREIIHGKRRQPSDYYYSIDIQVIQPTPEMSPTASEKNLCEDHVLASGLQVPGTSDKMHSLSVTDFEIGMAPLASVSTLGPGFSQRSSSISSKNLNSSFNAATNDDSTGSDSVFADADEPETDSEFEFDGFDDDYSFCDENETFPVKSPKLASFDSCDASTVDDSLTFDDAIDNRRSEGSKIYSGSIEAGKTRRKLSKTHSEPKNGRVQKILPPWTEKGRSGYVPKRQMSSPARKSHFSGGNKTGRKSSSNDQKWDEPKHGEDLTKFLLPPRTNRVSGDGSIPMPNIQRSNSASTQGLINDLPFDGSQQKTRTQTSLPSPREKRLRLQRQKNFNEETKFANQREKTEMQERSGGIEEEAPAGSIHATSGVFLKPPDA